MANVNDQTNQRSTFPLVSDTFVTRSDGHGAGTADDANIWNKIEAAIYRTQIHTQQIPHVVGSPDRRRVVLTNTSQITGGTSFPIHFTLTQAQKTFLRQPYRIDTIWLADAYRYDGSDDCTCEVHAIEPSQYVVTVKRLDPTQSFSAGSYFVRLTLMTR